MNCDQQKRRGRTSLATCVTCAAAVAAVAQCASAAQDFNFFDGGGGANNNWSLAANWNRTDGNTANVQIPDVEPTSNDLVAINNGGTVVIDQADEHAARVRLGQSNQVLTVPGPPVTGTTNGANLGQKGILNILTNGDLQVEGAFDLGNFSATTGTQPATNGNELNVTGGSLYTGNFLRVAVGAGSGTSTVNISSGLINVAQAFSTSSDGGQLYLGDAGAGTLNLSGTGSLVVLRQVIVGQNTTANGVLNVTGGTMSNGNDFVVGRNAAPTAAANGTVVQTAGSITSTGRYSFGFIENASGQATHSGGTLQVGQLDVGRIGRGSVTLNGSIVANVNSVTAVAKFAGSSVSNGVLTVGGNAQLTTAGLVVGQQGNGVLNLNGGTITVTGALAGGGFPDPAEANNELLNVLIGRDGGGAIATGDGVVNHTAGALNVATNLVIGDFDDSNGVYNISGGTLAVAGNANVGSALASNAPAVPVDTQGQAVGAKGTFHVIGNAATINIGGKFIANPGDRVRTGTPNQATLAFDIGTTAGTSLINVGGVADLDGAVVNMNVSGTTYLPAYQATFTLLTASSFGATGTGSTQNTGTGTGFTLATEDTLDWSLSVVTSGGRQSLVATNLVVPGDANNDKMVEFSDLLTVAQNYDVQTGRTRATGDFNRTGSTDFADLLILAQNYGFGVSGLVGGDINMFSASFASDWALAQSLVPEPTSLTVFAVSALLMRRRRSTR